MVALENKYKEYLEDTVPKIYKIPFIKTYEDLSEEIPVLYSTYIEKQKPGNGIPIWEQLRAINLVKHRKNSDILIQMYQRGQTISKVGRMRGNMEYLEDRWRIQMQPISFKYAFLKGSKLETIGAEQMKIRDKYLKIKVRYDGEQYVTVNAIKTKYTISHA